MNERTYLENFSNSEKERSYAEVFIREPIESKEEENQIELNENTEEKVKDSIKVNSDENNVVEENKNNISIKQIIDEYYHDVPKEKLPRLNSFIERKIKSNLRELSLIEGNLIEGRKKPKFLYCTSSFAKEGKTITAVFMGYGLSQYSRRTVLLVDCNFFNPMINKLFRINNEPGLQEVLKGKADLDEVIVPSFYENFYILTAGKGDEPLGNTFGDLISYLSSDFDYIIFDGKSILESSEVVNVSPFIDAYVLTVKCESTKWEIVQMVEEKISEVGGKIAGIVLNRRKYYVPSAVYRLLSKKS